MKVTFTSKKGGVGKSSLAQNFATYTGSTCITNDTVTTLNDDIIQIESNKKRIPTKLCTITNAVFDFGAMHAQLDTKIAQAARMSSVIVVPTLTDLRSLKGAVDTVNLVREANVPVAIIINNFKDQRKHNAARQHLIAELDTIPIFAIRSTTLFERVAQHGQKWFKNIHNEKGQHQLNKTRIAHQAVYDQIISIGEAHETTNA